MLRNVIKSPHDIRVYKNISLQNKINCLLISDKDADKSAASLSVKVGQIQDPIERPGLAHFLEHMLFLGTKKYPNQNDYSSFIASNSGSNNAYTGLMNTNYFFDCSNSSFEGALDRFSQFFISPLFTESCTDREINAVHSEHEKNLMSDLWRKMQLFRSTSVEGHPYNKFGTGNKGTLQHPTIRDDLLGFYQKYYSANLMNLVIYGKEDVATLENWAQQMFSTVPNFDTDIPKITDAAYTKENLGNFWKIHPIKDKDFLEFTWILDNLDPHYKNNPASYISHLIGHEGPNSLLSYLIDQGLALELSAGFNTEMELFSKFGIGIMLTKKGLANYEEVIRIVFEYLKMLRDRGAEERIFQEIKKMMKIGFDFKDKESPMNYVMSLADRMHNFPIEDIIRVNFLMEQYNPDLINSCIKSLKVDNLRINLVSKEVEKDCDKTEKWYGTKYSCTPFSPQLKAMFENPGTSISTSGKRLDLPPTNIFIPENFQLFTAHSQAMPKLPQKIYESDKTEIYYKQDIVFRKPKASVFMKLFCSDLDFGSNLKTYLLLDLWTKLFNEYLREMLYLASSASLGVSVSMDCEGVETAISGYNDSIDKISVALFEKMRDFDPRLFQQQYHNILETTLKNLRNFYKNQPYQQAMTFQSVMMKKGGDNYLPEEEIQVLEELKFEDLISFHENWFKTTRLEGLFVGNMQKDKVIQVSKDIEKIVAEMRDRTVVLPKDEISEVRVINLQSNTTWFYEHESKIIESGQVESNSAILSLFQFEKETPYTRVLMSILGNYMREPCFDKLRTDEQLGYIVSAFNADMRGILNYIILVQSNVQGPQYLSTRVLSFLDGMRERIKTMTDEEFAKFVESVRVRVLQKDLSIRQEAGRYWSEIANHKYVFDRKDRDLEQLDKVKKEDLLWVFEEIFYRNRKLYETHVVSVNHIEQNQKIKKQRLEDEKRTLQAHSPSWFKRRLPLYPDFNSML